MTTIRSGSLALLATVLLLACGDSGSGPSQPVPGPLQVILTSPNTDDGAVMFQVTGVVDSAVAPAGLSAYQSVPGPNVLRVIVTGNAITSGGSLLTLYVQDVNKASAISVQVLQVAAKGTYAARAASGYSLTPHK